MAATREALQKVTVCPQIVTGYSVSGSGEGKYSSSVLKGECFSSIKYSRNISFPVFCTFAVLRQLLHGV
ncbi:MAG: hypothetical protein ACLR82_11085 [Bifidobacterium longum]